MKNLIIKDWYKKITSLAVLLPTVITAIILVLEGMMETNLVPDNWLPIVIFVTGFLGRIIRQYKREY